MKKQLQLFFLILILFLGKESLSAQDFTYTIGTGNYLPGESNYLYFKPVSAKSTQVTAKITVTNNTSSAYTVNVDQSSFAQNPAWFPSSNTVSQDIDAGLPATYTITVKIPSNLTGNTATSSTINFDASQDGTGTPDNFSGPTYEVYVYNTAPPTPTIITSQSSATSNSIIVTWAAESSPDAYLTQYTNYINTKIGNNGIGYYQVIIANGSNKQTMPNDTARANVVSYNYSFTNLSSGTLYKITVQAVDVAGNPSALATYSVTTIPPAPSLTVSNINYCGGTLSWSSKGATSYTLFSNGSAIYSGTATSYTVSGLTPGETSPTYYVIATNSSGGSPNSLNENFTTISASAGSITGPSLLCVNSTGTYSSNTMQALNPAPTSIIWTVRGDGPQGRRARRGARDPGPPRQARGARRARAQPRARARRLRLHGRRLHRRPGHRRGRDRRLRADGPSRGLGGGRLRHPAAGGPGRRPGGLRPAFSGTGLTRRAFRPTAD